MKTKIKLLTAVDMLFLLLLSISGSTVGIISEVFYYLAFLAPVGIVLNYIYTTGESSHAPTAEAKRTMLRDIKKDFSISKEALIFSTPVFFPAIMGILGLSILSTAILSSLGYENNATFSEPLWLAIVIHALIPSVLEELLFRFAPIKLLSENKKTAFILSSVMFSFAHANLFQIPYALLAGAVLSALYIMTGSIWPSMIMHFLNNTISLLSIYGHAGSWFFIILGVLTAASITVVYIRRKAYSQKLDEMLSREEKIEFSYYPLFFIGTALLLAISALFV